MKKIFTAVAILGLLSAVYGLGSITDQGKKSTDPSEKVVLGPLDQKMVMQGKELFDSRCAICHSFDEKKLGPPLRNITKLRSPEFIMDMMLHTLRMEKEDPNVKKIMGDYSIKMPEPGFTQDQARAVLEYLRSTESEK